VAPADSDPGALVPSDRRKCYDVRDVARCIVDEASLLEVSAKWARSLVTAFARLDGRPVGLVASQPRHVGGVLNVAAAEKGARFVGICDAYRIPLVVLVDTPGFMPGSRQELAGVIRHGAKLVRAFASATVERCTVILRNAYGGAYIAMNCKDLGADSVLAWPNAEVGIMSPGSAVRVIHRRELAAATADEVADMSAAYARRHLPARIAVGDGLVDAIVEPRDTRAALVRVLMGSQSGALAGLP
jgi:acetyl-CoA carboxylase carboxyltransferase component